MRYRIDKAKALVQDLFRDLPKRARLTVEYLGWRALVIRVVTFPIRLTPWGAKLAAARATDWARTREWYRRHGRDVTVVIPSYGDPKLALDCVDSIRGTTDRKRVRIVVTDDGSDPKHVAALHAHKGIDEVVAHSENTGFAANCNRGLARSEGRDVVLLNSDVIAHPGWLEQLQYGAYREPDVGIAGPKLLYEDGTIQSAGSHRNPGAPEWFDHRYRFAPKDHPAANVSADAIAMTGAALYIKADTLTTLKGFDEAFGMAYEDVDLCLRCWTDAKKRVLYVPESELTHLESKTRGMTQGERELGAQRYFWEKWGDWFDDRNVTGPDGRVRVIYVTQDVGVGGGHRIVFEHLNGLQQRGYAAELWTLDYFGKNPSGDPGWFELDVPIRTFKDYGHLQTALANEEAIKVATWWQTAAPVWFASVNTGIPVFFVQDIETSYYTEDNPVRATVLSNYRSEFRYLTTSQWVGDRLRELHQSPTQVGCGIDLDTFKPVEGVEREPNRLLTAGRNNPLKNFQLTADAWKSLPPGQRPELQLFGIEPEVADDLKPHGTVRYDVKPSDAGVNELYNRATVYIQTSRHEGFCLPVLEAMAAGTPVICTDSHGNRDFCVDGENCLMPEATTEAVAAAITKLFADADLRDRLVEAGKRTAAEYGWDKKLDEVADFFERVSARDAGAAPASPAS